jgi:Tfp pilus assembly protein PilV
MLLQERLETCRKVPGNQEEYSSNVYPDPGGSQGGLKMADGRYPEKGMALLSVLLIVCLITMAIVASAALVTRATQTAAWSTERTRGLYAAEAGLNHWLYQMTLTSQGDGDVSEVLALTVTGEANGIPYVAKIAETDSENRTYRLVCEASTRERPVKVSLVLGQVSDAWRHVVCSTEQHKNVIEELTKKGYAVNNADSQWTPETGESSPSWMKDGKLVPIPIWEDGTEGYRPNLIAGGETHWDPPESAAELDLAGMTVELPSTGPVYYRNSRIGKLTGNLDGNLYLENCEIGEIDVSISGDIFAKTIQGERDSGTGTRIVCDVSGDVCLEESQISSLSSKPGGSIGGNVISKNPDPALGVESIYGDIHGSVLIESGHITERLDDWLSIGHSDVSTNIYGSVYIKGRIHGDSSTILRIAGPDASSIGTTIIHEGVFTQDANLLVDGGVDIRSKEPWPAILSDGWIILNGSEKRIDVTGPIYALANKQLSNRPGWFINEVLTDRRPELCVDESHQQIIHNAGVIAFGDDLYGNGPPRVQIAGSIVSPGKSLLVGNVHVAYDDGIAQNPPPWFTGADGELALFAGTWSYWRE